MMCTDLAASHSVQRILSRSCVPSSRLRSQIADLSLSLDHQTGREPISMVNRLTIVLMAIATSVLSANALAAVGRTPGQFAVSPTGSAQFRIPISAPPGPRGIQPALSLIYNSQSDAGPLGVGWSLAGLGSISRCNKTYAQDTTPAAIALVTSDGYCLNGNRLRLTSGSYGIS
jgi:Salmonella virulence plasmid 65kDa B protein